MDWSWINSFEQIFRGSSFPMWLTLAAAAFCALVLAVTLLRAERTVANGALAIITLLAIAVAAVATTRGIGAGTQQARAPLQVANASLPALSCMDDLAGDEVEAACERILFGSPDNVAAAVSYAAAQISSLVAFGSADAAGRIMTPALQALRHAIERDRYGFVAYVLTTRDNCTRSTCAAFQSLTDTRRIVSNIEAKTYESLVRRYSASWAAHEVASTMPSGAPAAVEGVSVPTGKPTNAEFPSAASIPPVNIMTPEPSSANAAATAAPEPDASPASPPTPAPRPAAASKSHNAATHQSPPARRRPSSPPPAQRTAPAPPVQLTPQPAR